jgi:hypothetical protein
VAGIGKTLLAFCSDLPRQFQGKMASATIAAPGACVVKVELAHHSGVIDDAPVRIKLGVKA